MIHKMQFSNQTSAKIIQSQIELKLAIQRRKGLNVLIPPIGKKFIIYIEDVNIPQQEKYGSIPPIEFLRQLIDEKGMYDKLGLFFKEIADTLMVVVGAYPGGARSAINPRFSRHFAVFNV